MTPEEIRATHEAQKREWNALEQRKLKLLEEIYALRRKCPHENREELVCFDCGADWNPDR